LPATPIAHTLGFSPLPVAFFAALAGMVIGYLVLIEVGKKIFYRVSAMHPRPRRQYKRVRVLRRRAARFSTSSPIGTDPVREPLPSHLAS
ncbi:MAG: hypothetical protein ABI137_11180, partial [Antricoccus sp.]